MTAEAGEGAARDAASRVLARVYVLERDISERLYQDVDLALKAAREGIAAERERVLGIVSEGGTPEELARRIRDPSGDYDPPKKGEET